MLCDTGLLRIYPMPRLIAVLRRQAHTIRTTGLVLYCRNFVEERLYFVLSYKIFPCELVMGSMGSKKPSLSHMKRRGVSGIEELENSRHVSGHGRGKLDLHDRR